MNTLDEANFDKKPKRGPAALDRQLSKLQYLLLTWLIHKEDELTPEDLKEFNRIGVVWKAKQFFVDCLGQAPTASQRAAVSRSLHRLDGRGLVVLSMQGERTTHIKLTPRGRTLAKDWSVGGLSERQTIDLEKRKANYAALVALREEKHRIRADLPTLSLDQIHAFNSSFRERLSLYTFCNRFPHDEQCSEYVGTVKQIIYYVDLLGTDYLHDEIPTVDYLFKLSIERGGLLRRP